MPQFLWSHHLRARVTHVNISSFVHRQSSDMHHHTRASVCLRRELKTDRHKSYPTMASGHCCRSSSTSHPARDDTIILNIVVVERARHSEYR
jgi:hypothetical protein